MCPSIHPLLHVVKRAGHRPDSRPRRADTVSGAVKIEREQDAGLIEHDFLIEQLKATDCVKSGCVGFAMKYAVGTSDSRLFRKPLGDYNGVIRWRALRYSPPAAIAAMT